jgi:lysophospholipase L1-like esterase
LADIRRAMEETVQHRLAADPLLWLVEGARLLDADALADGVHPSDAGHDTMAGAIGTVVHQALDAATNN